MNWVDYREKLGISFSDEDKFDLCRNRIRNLLPGIEKYYNENSLFHYANVVGELFDSYHGYQTNPLSSAIHSICKVQSITEMLFKYMALVNSLDYENDKELKERLEEYLISALTGTFEHFKIPLEIVRDKDGYFAFPKGVKEFDDALVSEPLAWLSDYPLSEKAWGKALRSYSNGDDPSQVADLFRKTLETFFGEFFQSKKTLENLKSEYGKFLKEQGVPAEIAGNFETLLHAYTQYMNGFAKHHDKTSINVLEYLMYQTGNIIRLLITVRKAAEEI